MIVGSPTSASAQLQTWMRPRLPRPSLMLLAWPNLEAPTAGWPISLPCRVEGGELRFLGVPANARLELRYAGRAHAIDTTNERVTRVDWPFGD